MRIHKKGIKPVLVSFFSSISILLLLFFLSSQLWINLLLLLAFLLLNTAILLFFRYPSRHCEASLGQILAPADGRIVAIEEVYEDEFFHDTRLQISIFMSIWDVHVNWYPAAGEVIYHKYHPGKYLVARNPKSSLLNERNTLVIQTQKDMILARQIAGTVARRIVSNANPGDHVTNNDEWGIIQFGSRLDIFLPVYYKAYVELNQHVKGNQSFIASVN